MHNIIWSDTFRIGSVVHMRDRDGPYEITVLEALPPTIQGYPVFLVEAVTPRLPAGAHAVNSARISRFVATVIPTLTITGIHPSEFRHSAA